MIIAISIAGFFLVFSLILILLNIRQRGKYKTLRAIYMNGDADRLGEPSSIDEWKRLTQASLEASRSRRKNGAH